MEERVRVDEEDVSGACKCGVEGEVLLLYDVLPSPFERSVAPWTPSCSWRCSCYLLCVGGSPVSASTAFARPLDAQVMEIHLHLPRALWLTLGSYPICILSNSTTGELDERALSTEAEGVRHARAFAVLSLLLFCLGCGGGCGCILDGGGWEGCWVGTVS